ncbi:unnamed protein product [Penicillium manginii]
MKVQSHSTSVRSNSRDRRRAKLTRRLAQTVEEIDRLCLRELRCPDSRLVKNRLKESKDKLLPESFEWILRDPKYESWRDGEEVCLLWIKGGAGKGKTMISIGLIEELLRFCRDKSSAITYFFCQNADNELNTLQGMMKGLILQLLRQQPALKECLRARWDAEKGSFDEDLTSWRALWHILLEMIDQCDCSKIYLLLDALDECQDGDMDEFLKALVRNGLHAPVRVKWLLTSRPLDKAERALLAGHDQVQLSLELESDRLLGAVKTYVTHKVNELGRHQGYEWPLKQKIESELIERSEGTFLWVSLVCKKLESVCPEEALVAIQNIPNGLHPLYRQVLNQLNCGRGKEVRMCMRLLKAMMLVYRPLKMGEFATIAGLEYDEDVSLMTLILRCASFLRLKGKTVEFVHQSARDYLAGKDAQLLLGSHEMFEDIDVVLNCLSCLSRFLKTNLLNLPPNTGSWSVAELREDDKSIVLDNVEYAAIFWGQHLRDFDQIDSRSHALGKNPIIDFLHANLLEWLECLSLFIELPVAIQTLKRLEDLFKVYASAVIWTPESSPVRRRNLDRAPWLRSVAPLEATWGSWILGFSLGSFRNHYYKLKVSSQSELVATAADPNTDKHLQWITLWDIRTGAILKRHHWKSAQRVREIGFSQNDDKIVWIAETNTIYSWEIMSQDVQEIPVERPGFGEIVVLSSTSTRVASIVSGHGILIWNIATGKIQSHVLLSHPVYDQVLFFSLDGTQVICDVSDRELCTWDTITGRLHKTLEKPPGFLRCLAYSPDGIHIAHHSVEANILLWDTLSGHTKRLEGYSYSKNPPVFSPDSKKVACRANDGSIKVWDVLTGSLQQSFLSDALELAFSPSGKLMISLTNHLKIDLWDVEAPSAKQIEPVGNFGEEEVAFSHDEKSIVCYTRGVGFFTIVDARTGVTQKVISIPDDINEDIWIARFLPGDENIVVALYRSVMIWEAATDTFQWQRDGNVSDIASSPNGEYLAGIVASGEIRIWNIRTRALTMTIKDHRWCFGAPAFSPNGKQIASYAYDKNDDSVALMIWDISRTLRTSKFLGNFISSHIPCKRSKKINLNTGFPPNFLKFSADGQYFLSDEGPIMASSTHAQTEDKKMPGNQPSHLHFGSGYDYGWICWGGQPFFRIPLSFMTYLGHDVRDEKIAIRYKERASILLILDIDTAILSSVLESTGSTYQDTSPFLNR